MKHFCTVADKNFRSRVLALNSSLSKYSIDYKLHLLCLDEDIYNSIDIININKYLLKNLIDSDELLYRCRNNNPSREALHNAKGNIDRAKEIQFIWSLAPYFTNYCLIDISSTDSILYIDSDVYFFDDWQKIYKNTDNINIGLVEHRIKHPHDNGKYNVGIVYFKKNDIGLTASALWKDLLIHTNHQFYKSHGGCGDQKYLELFEQIFPGVESFDKYFGHLAPWNFNYHSYTEKNIIWDDIEQSVMYCHFSDFEPDFQNNTYRPAPRHGIIDISKNILLNNMYNEYYSIVKSFEL